MFQISDPKTLLYEANQKSQIAEKVAEQIESRSNVKSDVTVYDGEEGFRTFWKHNIARMSVGDEYYVLGSLGDLWGSLMDPILPWLIKQMKKKKISIKTIAHVVNNKDNIFLRSGVKYEARLDPKGYQTPANTNIWKDYTFLQTAVPPYSVIEIYNPVLAQAYKDSFFELWDAAGPYPRDI